MSSVERLIWSIYTRLPDFDPGFDEVLGDAPSTSLLFMRALPFPSLVDNFGLLVRFFLALGSGMYTPGVKSESESSSAHVLVLKL